MPNNYENEEEFYGEEEGYAEDDGMEDYDEEEDSPAPARARGAGGGKDWVKTSLMGIAALLFLGGGGYYAATFIAPDVMTDITNSLPWVTKSEGEFAEQPPADPAVPGDGAATVPPEPVDPAGEGAAPPPVKKVPPKKNAVVPRPKPMPMPSVTELGTEGVPPAKPAAKPKWKKPAVAKGLSPWQTKMAARKAWLAKKQKWARATPAKKTASRWKKPLATSAARTRYAARTVRSRHAYTPRAARTYQARTGVWHTRYNQPAYSAGTRWMPGQAAYIPWGGGGAGNLQRSYGSAVAPAWHPQALRSSSMPRANGRYGVQVGSFADSGNAASLVGQLRSQGIPAYMGRGAGVSRVYIGNYGNRNQAAVRMQQLRNQGIPAAVTAH